MKVITNILKYDGKPFENPITLFVYEPKDDLKWNDFQWILRSLRAVKSNRRIPIAQDYKTLVAAAPISDDGDGNLQSFNAPLQDSFSPRKESEQMILRKLLGEAIATRLRTYTKSLWLVEEVSNSVFDVSNPVKVSGFGEMEVYQGFRYSPLVLRNGQVGVVIDPKHKFRSVKLLRDYYSEGVDIESLSRAEITPFVDVCPIRECPEKFDPFSKCRLASGARSLHLIRLHFVKPSECNPNLIEYSRNSRICPRTPMMADGLLDDVPVAKMRFSDFELYGDDDFYLYPLERIRIRPSFQDMTEDDREKIMMMIRPRPETRFELTEYFGDKVARIAIPNFEDLISTGFRDIWHDSTKDYDRVEPLIGGKKPAKIPSLMIDRFGPADSSVSCYDVIPVSVYWGMEPTKEQTDCINALFGDGRRLEVPSFSQYIKGRKTQVINHHIICDSVDKMIQDISKQKKTEPKMAVLLGYPQEPAEKADFCDELTKQLILRDIPKQGFSISLLEKKIEVSQKPYFRNVYLGLYTKIGGQAWALPAESKKREVIIGYSAITRSNETHFVLCTYSNTGYFLGGCYRRVQREDYKSAISACLSQYASSDYDMTIVLSRGSLYDFELDSMNDYEWPADVIIAECVDSPIRIYGFEKNRAFGPKIGSSVSISDTEIGIVTTGVSSGTPSPILLRKLRGKNSPFRDSIQLILNLTQCYTGYSRVSTRYPVPIHSSSRALSKARQLGLNSFDFKVAWFV